MGSGLDKDDQNWDSLCGTNRRLLSPRGLTFDTDVVAPSGEAYLFDDIIGPPTESPSLQTASPAASPAEPLSAALSGTASFLDETDVQTSYMTSQPRFDPAPLYPSSPSAAPSGTDEDDGQSVKRSRMTPQPRSNAAPFYPSPPTAVPAAALARVHEEDGETVKRSRMASSSPTESSLPRPSGSNHNTPIRPPWNTDGHTPPPIDVVPQVIRKLTVFEYTRLNSSIVAYKPDENGQPVPTRKPATKDVSPVIDASYEVWTRYIDQAKESFPANYQTTIDFVVLPIRNKVVDLRSIPELARTFKHGSTSAGKAPNKILCAGFHAFKPKDENVILVLADRQVPARISAAAKTKEGGYAATRKRKRIDE